MTSQPSLPLFDSRPAYRGPDGAIVTVDVLDRRGENTRVRVIAVDGRPVLKPYEIELGGAFNPELIGC